MRGADRRGRSLAVGLGALGGAAGGLLGTGAMYVVAAAALGVSGAPTNRWGPAVEAGFGGNVGTFAGLSGTSLHLVHGLLIGVALGVFLAVVRWRGSPERAAAVVGTPFGVALWAAVLALSPATRSTAGTVPPLALALGMHLAFALVATGASVYGLGLSTRSVSAAAGNHDQSNP